MIYTIYYGGGTAELCTKSRNWEERFNHLARQCFGIRKNILCCELIDKERGYPKNLMMKNMSGYLLETYIFGEKTVGENKYRRLVGVIKNG